MNCKRKITHRVDNGMGKDLKERSLIDVGKKD
jgi:hypothetical protein